MPAQDMNKGTLLRKRAKYTSKSNPEDEREGEGGRESARERVGGNQLGVCTTDKQNQERERERERERKQKERESDVRKIYKER